MRLISMKLDRKEAEEQNQTTALGNLPEYPYGLELHLNNEALEQLGMGTLPYAGDEMVLCAKVKVTGVHSNETQEGEDRCITLQITDMSLDEAEDDEDAGSKLYQ